MRKQANNYRIIKSDLYSLADRACPSEEQETKKIRNVCPRCGKQLIVGALYRIDKLADRGEVACLGQTAPFKRLISLEEIIRRKKIFFSASKRLF